MNQWKEGEEARRILVVAPQPFYQDRGTPIAVLSLVRAFAATGCTVDIATFPVGETVDVPGVRIIRTANPLGIRRVPIGLSLRKVVLDVLLFFTVARLLRGGRYHCVHGVEEGGFIAALLARRHRVPVIYDMQSSLPDQLRQFRLLRGRAVQRLLRLAEGWLIRRADLVACSAGLAPAVRAIHPGARVQEWAYPPPDTFPCPAMVAELRRRHRIPEGTPVVVYAGTFERYQGLEEVIAAVPRIRRDVPGALFVLVGADEAGGLRIARLAQKLGVHDSVLVVPRQPRERIVHYHALADVLLAPRALGRNVPLKLFDCHAAGRPVLATGMLDDPAGLDDDRIIRAPHSAAAIADALVTLLRDPRSGTAGAPDGTESRRQSARFIEDVRDLCDRVAPDSPATAAI